MTSASHRDVVLRRAAWACAALVLAIASLSAFLRLAKAGVGCEPWPGCAMQAAGEPAPRADTTAMTAARLAHRIVAGVTLVAALLVAMTTLTARPVRWREAGPALGMVALVVFLAVLGRWTAGSRAPAVSLGNLLGGFVLFALACRLALVAGRAGDAGAVSAFDRAVACAAALLLAQITLGGLLGAGPGGLDCPRLPVCDLPGGWLHNAHRAGAVFAAAVLLPLGVIGWRRGRRAGAVVVLALLLQIALGVTLVSAALPLAVAVAHNATAAILLAALVGLARVSPPPAEGSRRGGAPPPTAAAPAA